MIARNLENKEHSTVSFEVVVDAAEFEKAINTVYLRNKKNIFVQGFRKGKAPRMVIEGYYGKDVFYDDAAEDLAPGAFEFGVSEFSLRTTGRPTMAGMDVSEQKELTLTFTTAVWPEVTLGAYKGVEAPKRNVEISDELVEEELRKIQRRNARIVSAERPAQDGDTAIIDYSGTIDGVPFEGGSDTNHGLVLGSGTFIPGFEEQVIGMAVGEEKDITVSFPEDYHEASLAGKPAVFHVKVNDIKEEILPELDDEFAKDVSEFDTLDEYRSSIRARMEVSEKDEAESEWQNVLIEKAGDAIEADIPDAMIDEQVDNIIYEYDQNMKASGMSLEMYLGYMGQSMSSFRENCRKTAERRVRTELLLDKIAEVEKIEVSEQDIDEEYASAAERYGTELDVVKNAVPEKAVIGDIRSRRAAQIIFDNGVAVEPEEAPEAEAPDEKPEEPAD